MKDNVKRISEKIDPRTLQKIVLLGSAQQKERIQPDGSRGG